MSDNAPSHDIFLRQAVRYSKTKPRRSMPAYGSAANKYARVLRAAIFPPCLVSGLRGAVPGVTPMPVVWIGSRVSARVNALRRATPVAKAAAAAGGWIRVDVAHDRARVEAGLRP